jgi:hypothetical protein
MGEEGELPAAFPFPFLRFPYLPAAPVVTCFPKRKQFKVSGIAPLCSGPNLLRDFIILFFPKNLSTSRRSQKRYIFWGFLNKKKELGGISSLSSSCPLVKLKVSCFHLFHLCKRIASFFYIGSAAPKEARLMRA